MRFLRSLRPATYMSCKEIILILAGGPAMMGSLVACIHPHMDAAIDDVRLLFISAPAAFQVNINNIKPELLACQMRIPSAGLVFYNRVLYGLKFICFNDTRGSCRVIIKENYNSRLLNYAHAVLFLSNKKGKSD